MLQQISTFIKITATPTYLNEQMNDGNGDHFFTYTISIENTSKYPIKLLSRYWRIVDAAGYTKNVEGDGVVGRQPIIDPGQKYVYSSAVSIESELGRMGGFYTFIELSTMQEFDVTIPDFDLVVPAILN